MKVYIRVMSLTDGDLKKLDKMMKKAVLDGTAEALEAIVFPKFDEIDKNLSSLKEEVGLNTEMIARVERKLDRVTDHQAEKLDDHEKRISQLENPALA